VNVSSGNGNSTLHIAVENNNLPCVKLLLTYKAGVNVKSPKDLGGYTPLHIAAQRDFWKIAQLLLENKANVNALSESGSTPLIEAAKYGKKNMVAILLRKNPEASVKDKNGMSAYYYAKKGIQNYVHATHRHSRKCTHMHIRMHTHMHAHMYRQTTLNKAWASASVHSQHANMIDAYT